MTRKDFEELVFDTYGIEADYPFSDDYESGVFRHRDGKWFAIAMNIPNRKIGIDDNEKTDIVNFKCAPEVIESLVGREQGIYRAYHMNKMHWLTVNLSESDEALVSWLLGISFELTGKKTKRKT